MLNMGTCTAMVVIDAAKSSTDGDVNAEDGVFFFGVSSFLQMMVPFSLPPLVLPLMMYLLLNQDQYLPLLNLCNQKILCHCDTALY